jgi:hypothetical protein
VKEEPSDAAILLDGGPAGSRRGEGERFRTGSSPRTARVWRAGPDGVASVVGGCVTVLPPATRRQTGVTRSCQTRTRGSGCPFVFNKDQPAARARARAAFQRRTDPPGGLGSCRGVSKVGGELVGSWERAAPRTITRSEKSPTARCVASLGSCAVWLYVGRATALLLHHSGSQMPAVAQAGSCIPIRRARQGP